MLEVIKGTKVIVQFDSALVETIILEVAINSDELIAAIKVTRPGIFFDHDIWIRLHAIHGIIK